jgi:uncharacterized protein YneR
LITADVTAKSNEDYDSLMGISVTFAANESIKCVPVIITNDTISEGNETFSISLSTNNPDVTLKNNWKTLTIVIIDDDSGQFNNKEMNDKHGFQ